VSRVVRQLMWLAALVAGLVSPAFLAGAMAPVPVGQVETSGARGDYATVRDVAIVRDGGSYAIEIASTVAVIPAISQSNSPPRLVIDLLGAVDASAHQVAGHGDIKAVHISQSNDSPPLTRIAVDLTAPRSYVWEVVDNRLLIHLRPVKEPAPREAAKPTPPAASPTGAPTANNGAANTPPPNPATGPAAPATTAVNTSGSNTTVPNNAGSNIAGVNNAGSNVPDAIIPGANTPGVPVSPAQMAPAAPANNPVASRGVRPGVDPDTPTDGVVLMAGRSLVGNSAVTAGPETAILNLARGGQLHVCPGTTVSVTSSKTGRDLMLGMSTGALEAHYRLSTSSDSILTPDFRILLQGPAVFHYAVSADTQGNTCVRSLQGNTGTAIIAELIGDGAFQLKPGQQVVFRGGQLARADANVPIDCGCPHPHAPVLRAEGGQGPLPPTPVEVASQPPIAEPINARQQGTVPASDNTEQAMAQSFPMTPPQTASAPPPQPNQVHVHVEAPLVYRAKEAVPTDATKGGGSQTSPATPANGAVQGAETNRPGIILEKPEIAKPRRGFFGRVKHFLANVFG